MIADRGRQVKLTGWTDGHAVAMLTGSLLIGVFGLPVGLLALLGGCSFVVLIYRSRGRWTPGGRFGWANGITLLRLLLVLALALIGAEPAWPVICLSITAFALDGVDGWLARKLASSSEFGEYFDKETDALFMLLLCWLLYVDQRLGVWILFPGLMRYLFVVLLMLVKPPVYKEPQTATGKTVFAVTVSVLIFCFSDFQSIYQPLALLTTALLGYSFTASIYLIFRSAQHEDQT